MSENGNPKYQATYMVGPINVTVRLNGKDEGSEITNLIDDLAYLVEKARQSDILNAKVEVTATPYQAAPVERMKVKCETCQADMKYQSGTTKTGKNAGKPYEAYFCPNAIKGDYKTHQAVWL